MPVKSSLLGLGLLICCCCAHGRPVTPVLPGTTEVSAFYYSPSQGSGAQIFGATIGMTPKFYMSTEFACISDDDGSANIGTIFFNRPLKSYYADKLTLAGCAGLTWLTVDERFGGKNDTAGPAIGATATYQVKSDLVFYTRGSVAALNQPLWTLDIGASYQLTPKWQVSAGYRGYAEAGSGFGGFMVGANYKHK